MVEARRVLEECGHLDARVDSKLEEMERTKALSIRVTAAYSAEPRGGSQTDKMADAVSKIDTMAADIADELDQLLTRRRLMRMLFAAVSSEKHRHVLEWRYCSRWGWAKIGEALQRERMQVWRIHDRALADVQAVLDKMEADGRLKPALEASGLADFVKKRASSGV